MLNAEVPFERLLVFNFSHRLAIEVSLYARTLADDLELVPFLGLEQTLGSFLVVGFLALGRVEPPAHPDPVDTARLGLVNFALVALGFAFVSNEPEAQARIEACVVEGNLDLRLDLEIFHFKIGHDPNVDLGEEPQFTVLGHEGFYLGPGCPSMG